VPQLRERLEFLKFRAEFPGKFQELSLNFSTIFQASQQVKSSKKFKKLLKIVFQLGEILNRGTYLSSRGFKLESLNNLVDTKAKNNKTTLLDYLVDLVHGKDQEILNLFQQELHFVEKAAKLSFLQLSQELKDLKLFFSECLKSTSLVSQTEKKSHTLDMESKEGSTSGLKIVDHFQMELENFLKENHSKLEDLEKRFLEMKTSFSELVTYYGEEANEVVFEKFFVNLYQFSKHFHKAIARLNQQKSLKTAAKEKKTTL
jgi:hypothetical protein